MDGKQWTILLVLRNNVKYGPSSQRKEKKNSYKFFRANQIQWKQQPKLG